MQLLLLLNFYLLTLLEASINTINLTKFYAKNIAQITFQKGRACRVDCVIRINVSIGEG